MEESREPRSKCVLTVEERERSVFQSIIDVKDILRIILLVAKSPEILFSLPFYIKQYLLHASPPLPQEVINTGLFHMKSTCRRCHGQGKIITTPCHQCSGTGTTVRAQSVSVQVPAGVADGQTLRVPVGQSEAYVVLQVSGVQLK